MSRGIQFSVGIAICIDGAGVFPRFLGLFKLPTPVIAEQFLALARSRASNLPSCTQWSVNLTPAGIEPGQHTIPPQLLRHNRRRCGQREREGGREGRESLGEREGGESSASTRAQLSASPGRGSHGHVQPEAACTAAARPVTASHPALRPAPPCLPPAPAKSAPAHRPEPVSGHWHPH
jgi:hypothetical protein